MIKPLFKLGNFSSTHRQKLGTKLQLGDDLLDDKGNGIQYDSLNKLTSGTYYIKYPTSSFEGEKVIYDIYKRTKQRQTREVSIGVTNADGSKYDLDLPHGLTVVIGPSNTGKSALMNYISSQKSARLVKFQEPEVPSISSPSVLLSIISDFLVSDDEILLIDSLRFFLYNGEEGSAAVSGGLSSSIFTDITNLSVLAEVYGKTIVAVLNFLSVREETEAMVLNSMIGAASAVISSGQSQYVGQYHIVARTDQNKRQKFVFSIDVDFGGVDSVIRSDGENKTEHKQTYIDLDNKVSDRISELMTSILKIAQ